MIVKSVALTPGDGINFAEIHLSFVFVWHLTQ